ncbi:MAG: baseplate J/gp47 family protein, partial [bacterium]|nr:baseplate J/gp47 family protein [bacterium]
LTSVANIEAVINGSNAATNAEVISSTKSNNPIPGIGGKGLPSTEEIKYNIAANHAAQERCVTIGDYTSRAYQMGGKFGVPFRIHSKVDDNKVKMYILSIDGNGKLVANSTSRIKNNIVTYLSKYRMVNDFVEVNDAKVVNISLNVDLYIDANNFNTREIKAAAIEKITDFFNVDNWQMGQNIYISQLTDILRELPGVINVVNIDFFNMQGGGYSETLHAQSTGTIENIIGTGGYRIAMNPQDNALFGSSLAMFELRNPGKDVKIRVAS